MLGWPVCCLSVHRFPVNLSLLLSVFCEVLIKSCDQVCSVFPDSETAVLWLQCVSCVPPPCLTSWRVWRAQAGWSTSKLFWMQASSSPRSVWRLILTVCLTVALNIGLGVGLFVFCIFCVSVWNQHHPSLQGRYEKPLRLSPRFTRMSHNHWQMKWLSYLSSHYNVQRSLFYHGSYILKITGEIHKVANFILYNYYRCFKAVKPLSTHFIHFS